MAQPLSIGKLRGLQQCATARGAIAVLAIDHRNNLRNALNPANPASVADADMIAFKRQVVAAVAPAATAVLLDPEVGAAQCIASGALPGQVGLILAVEATGYTGDTTARSSRILPGWSLGKSRQVGASAVKLLVYYHPDSPTAGEIEAFVRQTAAECARLDLALFLEPLSYSLVPGAKKLAPDERRYVVLETARRLVVPGVDVLKAEFPIDYQAEPEEAEWERACADLSNTCPAPWVLLSASVPFDVFMRQVQAACRGGASGVAVGRAVWQEAVGLDGPARQDFLMGEALQRMGRATAVCHALARPWTDFYQTEPPHGSWYQAYGC